MRRLFLANVGVNTADGGLRSPIFPDGTFEFVPIREERKFAANEMIPTYIELRAWTGRTATLAEYVAPRIQTCRAHADPEFEATSGRLAQPICALRPRVISCGSSRACGDTTERLGPARAPST